MKATPNFNPNILNLSAIIGNLKTNINKSLKESSQVLKKNIKEELRSPNKTGALKSGRRKRFSERRSASGESLARETGASERLISSQSLSNSTVEVGFLENPFGFDYVAYQELEKNRPTVEKAGENSLKEIETIFDKNFTPK
jgi:hypothetical protein